MPTFNLRGKEKVTTIAGGLLTSFILTLTMAYAIQKLFSIYEKSDPTININIDAGVYSKDNGLDIKKNNLRFAFSYYENMG